MSILKNDINRWRETNFHLIPGRLRIGVPGLLNNQDFANGIAHHIVKFTGVKVCYANPISGQVLINYDPDRTDLKQLLSWIFCLGNEPREVDRFPAPVKTINNLHSEQQGQSILTPGEGKTTPWHLLNNSDVLTLLGSSSKTGLSHHDARERLVTFGHNVLKEGEKNTLWQVALSSLDGLMIKLLLISGGVSLLVGEKTDAAVIVAIVLVQAAVETAQNYRAEKSLDNLKEFSAPVATVLRGGEMRKISCKELVPGDILYLNAGDIVPADAVIVEAISLTTNEACLTGESIPVVKDSQQKSDPRIPVADRSNMLFSGTNIIGGRATAVVVATGMQTELGRIARLLGDVRGEQTNLQKQLDFLGKKITHLVVISVITIAAINLLRGLHIWDVLRAGISLAVGAVPEGLPAILAVALSAGVQRMVRRNAVVRNRSVVETLGSTTVICTDKTGTLTKNEMTVKELYIDRGFYDVTGESYRPVGQILRRGGSGGEGSTPNLIKTLKVAALCNNAELRPSPSGKWTVMGDPTEVALLTVAAKAGLWWQALRNKYCRHREIAFDAQRRLMVVVCREPDGSYGIYVKGAPDAVINYCSSSIGEPGKVLDLKTRNKILAANEKMARKALRVLAFAYKKLLPDTNLDETDLESDLIFCGLAGMSDTPREGVQEAISRCRAAGVKVIMITGDHQRTAEAIAVKLGILGKGKSITGRELEQISDEEFAKQAGKITVYSRTTPDQKLRIVRALKGRGQIVAMTGDGVNDAPAIKEADIGIAMGLSGTDVTRGVADIVLSDDNFVTIVNGIEEGRAVSMNLTKSMRYILSGSLSQILMVFATATLGLPAPLLPAQILWVNLVTESLPAMSFLADPPEQDYMNQPPLKPEGRFLPDQGRAILQKGVLYGLSTFVLYTVGLKLGDWPVEKARTMAFSQLVLNRVFSLITERKTGNTRSSRNRGNPLIFPAAMISTFLLAVTMYLPLMRPLFSTIPLGPKDWAILAANALVTERIDSLIRGKSRETPGEGSVAPRPETGSMVLEPLHGK